MLRPSPVLPSQQVIPAGVPRKPGMTRQDLFHVNATLNANFADAVKELKACTHSIGRTKLIVYECLPATFSIVHPAFSGQIIQGYHSLCVKSILPPFLEELAFTPCFLLLGVLTRSDLLSSPLPVDVY